MAGREMQTPHEQTQQNGNIHNFQSQKQNARHQSELQEQIPITKMQNVQQTK